MPQRTLLARFVILALVAAPLSAQRTIAVEGASWFDGEQFVARTMYIVGDRFSSGRPARVDSTMTLPGKFIVPPLGEAHNHNLESSRFDQVSAMYISRGVFYVKNPNSLDRFTTPIRSRINTPTGIDAVFAGGGLTGPGGHPQAIAMRQVNAGRWTAGEGDGGFFYAIGTAADFVRRWPEVRATQRDFLKIYLLHSEEYAARRDDPAFLDWRGLDPAVVSQIVDSAHRAGLRVSAHVESAADFRAAVAAGVDEVAHVPGFRPDRNDPASYSRLDRFRLLADDARAAAAAGVVVVTTLGGVLEALATADTGSTAPSARAVRDMLRANVRTLANAGVQIAIGSDEYTRTVDFELQQLDRAGVLSRTQLLRAACEVTALAIFPGRRIGRLADGYEASFLALDANPLDDLSALSRISLRVKQGILLP